MASADLRERLADRRATRLLLLALGVELLEIREQIVDLLLILQSGIDHFGAWDFGFGILDVFAERRFVPGDARVLVCG